AGQAQNEGNVWYFGNSAGLDFNGSKVKVLTDGAVKTREGSAAICDSQGNLLFYTDGITVWDREHRLMANGTELSGHPSSTQSGVIVPQPGSQRFYYLFTVDAWGDELGTRYSLIDLESNGGYGEVILSNQKLLVPSAEKIAAVVHENGRSIWVLIRGLNNNVYKAYLIDENGLNPEKVMVSKVGRQHFRSERQALGYMKFSSDGSRVAVASFSKYFEIFDFDRATGKLSNPVILEMPENNGSYGCAFSPDNRFLYITYERSNKVYQLDLNAGSPENIVASAIRVGESTSEHMGALQLGPDGRLYVARWESEYIGIIESPNLRGPACQYVDDGLFLEGGICMQGLPTFVATYFEQQLDELFAFPCDSEDCFFKMPLYFYPETEKYYRPIGCEPEQYQLYIYDKDGNTLMQTSNFYRGWDGNYQFEALPAGSYQWLVRYQTDAGTEAS
ncbi:MAG: beta-propeller fold lactonase family protein, partial [Bacteroidota bacterium]